MSAKVFADQQPRDGETIMHCGHLVGRMYWFQHDRIVGFQRLDGTRGEAEWFCACEACFVRHGEDVVKFVRGDGVWRGDEPAVEKVES